MITNAEEFQGALLEFESWLPSIASAVEKFEPIASDPVDIKEQLIEAEASNLIGLCEEGAQLAYK